MKAVTLNLPDTVEIDSKEIAMIVAAHLYEQGQLSLRHAAPITIAKQTSRKNFLPPFKTNYIGPL